MAATAEIDTSKSVNLPAIGVMYSCPPESEIYGRSLSTLRRLGAFMVGRSQLDTISSPEADQARVEFYTSVEEGFGTDVELGGGLEVRDFDTRPVIAGRVMAKDLKTPVSYMTEAGLACGVETAKKDHRFLPQLTRSKWDHENALVVDDMARGETDYNTRIVISPFPEEAAAQSGDNFWRDIGYVPHLKRGFVQLYHTTEEGVIAGSLSFDGSNKERLRKVFEKFGVVIPEAESTDNWLNYAITDSLSAEEAKRLAVEIADLSADPAYKKTTNTIDVTHRYRPIMDKVFNESYVHICESLSSGCQTAEIRGLILQLTDKAHNFNSRYAEKLYKMRANPERFTDEDSIVLHELLVYSTIEMMRALHLREKVQGERVAGAYVDTQSDAGYFASLNAASFQNVLSDFGGEGARNNRTYSACGLSISLGEAGGQEEGPQSAFGGKEKDSDADCEFISKECPLCHSKNVKTKVSKISNTNKKRISGSCGCSIVS